MIDPQGSLPARRRGRRVLARAAPSAALVAILLCGFLGRPEDSAWLNRSYLWGPGDPFFSEGDERFVAHPLLVWRGNPRQRGEADYAYAGVTNPFGHNALGLRDDDLADPVPAGVVRVVNLGDSSTWGLNLRGRSETYSDQLEAILAAEVPGQRFDVVNAGTIGYSSLQGLRFLQVFGRELDADVVTVYLGNNEPLPSSIPDRARSPEGMEDLRSLLGRNAFYLLARKALMPLFAGRHRREARELDEALATAEGAKLLATKEDYYRLMARVPPEEYEANLRRMVALCRSRGERIVLLDVPMNLLWPPLTRPVIRSAFLPNLFWCPVHVREGYLARAQAGLPPLEPSLGGHPYLSLASREEAEGELRRRGLDPAAVLARAAERAERGPLRERVRSTHNLAVWALVEGRPERAAELLEQALAWAREPRGAPHPQHLSAMLYALGVARFLQGRPAEAFEHLRACRGAWPFAMSPDYRERFQRVVQDLEVEWVDLPARFAAADPRFGGSALMHDWVHPNAEGNRVIAEALAEVLAGTVPGGHEGH